ncbi:MAG: TetR/AcrR family transcriptional regulator [Saccharofermentanales bacterium]|jgi:AcrR family transcriptional regulator|nr:TetR/AcrR family transcriptional regulator [Clostridiaceae bacterium]
MSIQSEKSTRTKQKLTHAAVKLFKEKGFESTNVRDIAATAGMTTGSFYHHFRGKIEVLNEIYDSRDVYFGKLLGDLAQHPPYNQAIYDFFVDHMVHRVADDGKDFTWHRMFGMKKHSTTAHELYKGMIGLIEKAQDAGELDGQYLAETINEHLFLVFRGVTYEWCLSGEDDGEDHLKDLMERHIAAALQAFVG